MEGVGWGSLPGGVGRRKCPGTGLGTGGATTRSPWRRGSAASASLSHGGSHSAWE